MSNTISHRLLLLTLVLVVMMGAYGVFMYYSAKRADIATDLRNEKLVIGLLNTRANRIGNLAAHGAVSNELYDSVLSGNLSRTLDDRCLSDNKDGLSVSFAVFGEHSGLKYLCEYGQSKPVVEHAYLNRVFEEKSAKLVEDVRQLTEDGFIPSGEFIHEQGYFEFHNLPYYYVAAAIVPRGSRTRPPAENHYYFVLHNLRGKFRQISSDFLSIQHRGDHKADLRVDNEFVTVISTGSDTGVHIGWPRSQSYRDQFVTLIPIILAGIIFFTLFLWRNINKISSLHNELARREEQARYSASHDGMTGLINRQCFEAGVYFMLEKYFGKQKVYVGLLDLDKFKSVNDTHGHQTGDELIKVTASRLDEVMGPDNLAARLGGDEFSFAFTETDPQAAEQRIQHLSDKLKEVVEFNSIKLQPGASIGVCEAVPGVNNREILLNLADRALYDVKEAGRGGFKFHQHRKSSKTSSEMSEPA